AEKEVAVRHVNPMSEEQPVLRTSLLPRLVGSVAENLKHEKTVRLFEIGHVFLATQPDELPVEPHHLAIAYAVIRQPFARFAPQIRKMSKDEAAAQHLDFFDVKGALEPALTAAGITDVAYESARHDVLHPGRTASVLASGQVIGTIGEVRPDTASELGVADYRLVVAEINLQRVLELTQSAGKATDRKSTRLNSSH